MEYIFDVSCHETETVIQVKIAYGSSSNNVVRTIKFEAGKDNNEPNLDELISDMVDNIRLTVKEREEAMHNAKVFKDYVQLYSNQDKVRDSNEEAQMIFENGDPAVLNENKYELR